jgi:hypothetical protein
MDCNAIALKGAAAEVVWGYHSAVTLKNWTMTPGKTGVSVTADVVSVDAFRASQQPLTFVVHRPQATWKWPVHTLQIAGTSLTATLGPPKE